jgi:ribosomal protein L34E
MGSELVGIEKQMLFKDIAVDERKERNEEARAWAEDDREYARSRGDLEAEPCDGGSAGNADSGCVDAACGADASSMRLTNSDGSSSIAMSRPDNRLLKGGRHTGPKGVLSDFEDAKLRMRAQMEKDRRERMQAVETLTRGAVSNTPSTSFSATGDQRSLVVESTVAADAARRLPDYTRDSSSDSEDDDEAFFSRYRSQRMMALQAQAAATRFGEPKEVTPDEFLKELADAARRTPAGVVVVHLHDPTLPACGMVNKQLREIAARRPTVRFLTLRGDASMRNFDNVMCPAINVYRGKDLFKSLFKITDDLGQSFTAEDLEWLLANAEVFEDKTLVGASSDGVVVDF